MTEALRLPKSVRHDRRLLLDRPRLMGIVNATPDSFSDGGLAGSPEALVGLAMRMIEEGADVIDVGGESSRPGAASVPVQEQIERTCPVIERIRACADVLISIDTTSSVVASAALDAGADFVNDVSAGDGDPQMLSTVAARGTGIVLMHRRVPPSDDRYSDQYARPELSGDISAIVRDALLTRAAEAERAGIDRSAIVLDPGLGFGKTVEQNWTLIAEIDRLVATGYVVLGAASRKSFVGAVTGVAEPRQRLAGSLAAAVAMAMKGVRLFRVHDVAPHAEALAAAWAACSALTRRGD